MTTHATVWSGILASGTISAGYAAVKAGSTFVIATAANRATYGRASAIAITSADTNNPTFEYQVAGIIPTSLSGLGVGTDSWVRVSATGTLERCTPAAGDDLVGQCNTAGDLTVTLRASLTAAASLPLSVANGGTGASGLATGVIKSNGSVLSTTGLGTANQVLATNSGATGVEWQTVSARPAGTCTPEQFGAVGDGVTNDTTDMHEGLDALKAGTYGAMILGAKTYLMDNYTWDGGAGNGGAIVGQGPKSVIKYRIANPDGLKALLFPRNINSFVVKNCTLQGDDSSSQTGILVGIADSTAPQETTIEGVVFRDFALKAIHTTNAPVATSQVLTMSSCRIEDCATGIVGGAQMLLEGVNISGCTTAMQVSAGNLTMVGCVISENTTGLQLVASGNDGHGTVTGCTFNHNTTSLEIQDIANGMTFSGCHFYACSLTFDNIGIVDMVGCSLRPITMTFTDVAAVRFVNCRLEDSSWTTLTIADTCAVEFINCRDLDGSVPPKIRDYVQVPYTFSSDANKTLTRQQSHAEAINITGSVLSAGRDLTSAITPAAAESRRIWIRNAEGQTVTYKWSTGTGVAVAAGKTALIGSDGTNAIALLVGA